MSLFDIKLPEYDYDELKELEKVDVVLSRVGFNIDVIERQLCKTNTLEGEQSLLKKFYYALSESWDEIDTLTEELDIIYGLYLDKKYKKVPYSKNQMTKEGKEIIKMNYHHLEHNLSKRIVDLLLEEISFEKVGEGIGYLDDLRIKIIQLQTKVELLLEQNYHLSTYLLVNEGKVNISPRLVWNGDEESIIAFIKNLINHDYISSMKDLNQIISNHFIVPKSKLIPSDTNGSYEKIIWKGLFKDLLLTMKYLIDYKFIDHSSHRNIMIVEHFNLKGEDLVLRKVQDYFNQIRKRSADYSMSVTLSKVLTSLK